ncbi:MAG: MSCRAMM family adhesin SdrC, partial [Actinobacteria bacterium]|nr:MSCRAMM family adhesin SdrC [Actinomycetota bacterium]
RLRASTSHRIPDETRQQHLAAIGQALSEAAPTSTVATSGRFTQLRRGLTAVAASLSLLVPTGVAVASQGAMPGQPLYDVKQATEVVWQVVDGTVRARNRVDELERLLDAGAPRAELQVAVQRALDAVQALPADHPLQLRLLRLLNRYDRLIASTSGDQGGDDRSGDGDDDDVRAPSSGSSGDDRDDDDEDRSGSGSGDEDADDDSSGPGSDDPTETETETEFDDDNSGSGSGTDDDPSGSESDDDNSGSGSGTDDDPTETETDDDSSGPGSVADPTELETDDDNSGSGSGSD